MAESPHTNMAFTKAAFAFKDGLDKSRATKKNDQVQVTVKPVETPQASEKPATLPSTTEQAAHQARHQRRIRIARAIQHLLTSILSIAIAFFQGKIFVFYKQTQNKPQAWPMNPNLVPTLMLFVTALAALTIDACALVAYFWPKTSVGRRAYSLASSAYAIYTTVKTISYTFSAVICKTGMDHGTSSGNLDDLWSWTCSKKGTAEGDLIQADANCMGSYVAWYLALTNIGIEVLGVIINQVAKQDAAKFKSKAESTQDVSIDVEKHDDVDSDTKPLLSPEADTHGSDEAQKRPQSKADDDFSSQFDKLSDELDNQLNSSLPKMSGS